MNRKIAITAVLLLILAPSLASLISNVSAAHEADVSWAGELGTIIDSQIRAIHPEQLWTEEGEPINALVFEVHNNLTSGGDLAALIQVVEVLIPPSQEEGREDYAAFLLKDTNVTNPEGQLLEAGEEWYTEIIETDPDHEVRSFRFYCEEKGIPAGKEETNSRWFHLYFRGGPLECNYKFVIWTHDDQGNLPPEAHRYDLYLMMDNTPPVVTTIPEDGDIVHGITAECGNNYFLLEVSAHDEEPHDTGIKSCNITIDDELIYSNEEINFPPGKEWTLPPKYNEVWNLGKGEHTIEVTVCDGVGNCRTVINNFTYIQPDKPFSISGPWHAALETTIKDSETGLVESKHYSYGDKEFGTLVTATGNSFGANLDVRVTVYIETYDYYYDTYGTYNVLVAIAKTGSDGAFTVTFNFPKAPAGKYRVSARSTEMFCYADSEVLPQIIFDPHEVIGPALINVEATGFMSVPLYEWPETWTIYVLCNNKDTLQGVNEQVYRNWYIDGNGTLQNEITFITGHFTENGLYWPALQPGTYEVTLFVATTGSYWNISHWELRTSFTHGNTITVVSTLDLLPKIYDKIVGIEGDVAKILTEVGLIELKLDDIKPRVIDIQGRVVHIETIVDDINGTLISINDDVAIIKTDVGNVTFKADDILALIEAPADLTLTVNIAAVLSAVAAIAAIIGAAVVTKRLKVAV